MCRMCVVLMSIWYAGAQAIYALTMPNVSLSVERRTNCILLHVYIVHDRRARAYHHWNLLAAAAAAAAPARATTR